MNNLSELIVSFMIATTMGFSGYAVALIGDYIKKMIAIPLLCMFIFDMVALYGFYMLETSKIQMMFGVMLGTILKIILFVLYQKYLSDE
tara:strand:+ start:1920 stop:2186 length:267 start_codon:yes stop_codon:yes gene_type:complete